MYTAAEAGAPALETVWPSESAELHWREKEQTVEQLARLKPLFLRGVGVHHAGLTPAVKELIELAFEVSESHLRASSPFLVPWPGHLRNSESFLYQIFPWRDWPAELAAVRSCRLASSYFFPVLVPVYTASVPVQLRVSPAPHTSMCTDFSCAFARAVPVTEGRVAAPSPTS